MGLLRWLFGRKGPSISGGFLADRNLARVLDCVLEGCEYVVGAGAGAPETVVALARRHPHKECLACEPSSEKCFELENAAEGLKNVYMHNAAPGRFLDLLAADKPYLFGRDVLFLLSAAGGGAERRFFEEVGFVAGSFQAAFLSIHGFRVPEREDFDYDSQRGRECSLKNVGPLLTASEHTLHFPAYAVRASRKRRYKGWCLASMGRNAEFSFPGDVKTLLSKPE